MRTRQRAFRLVLGLCGLGFALVLAEALLAAYATTREARLPDLTDLAGTAVLCVGDSVTFGTGIRASQAWPAQLAERLAGTGATVHNVGLPGLRFSGLGIVRGVLDALPPGVRPLVVVMLGHNDFATALPAPPPSGLRLLRVFAWLDYTAAPPLPPPPATPPFAMEAALGGLDTWARARGGSIRVANYAVPGAWHARRSDLGTHVDRIRPHVRRGNAVLADLARATSVPFVDVHAGGAFPERYDSALFIDSIHLTAEGSARVAAVLEPVLRADIAPLSALP